MQFSFKNEILDKAQFMCVLKSTDMNKPIKI